MHRRTLGFCLLALLWVGIASVGGRAAYRRYVRAHVGSLSARSRMKALREIASHEPTAANYRLLADASLKVGEFKDAQDAFSRAANIYRSKGLISEGYVADALAERYEITAIPLLHVPTDRKAVAALDTHAKFEPVYGCYAGAFIDHEDTIRGTYRDEYNTWRRDVSAFNHLTDTHHAIFFMYLGYGRKFPAKFVSHVAHNVGAAQIAWEPEHLSDVQDDAYLHDFAAQAKASGAPIFLRFASEMNGDWVPYNGNPALYIQKFRLVAEIMHREAPNVAMVWCPFETPVRTMADYYPGDDAVDWVGINIYSVPFWDNDPHREAMWRNPADQLRFIYGKYASRHPIMICEYAASHRSSLDQVERDDFAIAKLGQLYAALPAQYPRVKAVCWLSMNAIKHAIPGRQSNDYSLLGADEVRRRYAQVLKDPYYLRTVSRHEPAMAKQQTVELIDGSVLHGRVALGAWVKAPEDNPHVAFLLNGQVQFENDLPGPHRWVLNATCLPPGPATIELVVTSASGAELSHVTRHVTLAVQ